MKLSVAQRVLHEKYGLGVISEADPEFIFEDFATDLGLDLDQFLDDLSDPEIDQRIQRATERLRREFGTTPARRGGHE